MWRALNPFYSVKLQAVVPARETKSAEGPETMDPRIKQEIQGAQLRSLLARERITMLHETLAAKALAQMRG